MNLLPASPQGWLLAAGLLIASASPSALADTVPGVPASPALSTAPEPCAVVTSGSDAPKLGALKVGVEAYLGFSNARGNGRFTDGYWAGSRASFPSTTSFQWESGSGQTGRLALGMGQTFIGRGSYYEQPAEAWWQFPVKGATLTAGKYWVPFGQQEWEYEAKPGLMADWTLGRVTLTGSANANRRTGAANGYFRTALDLGSDNSLGFTLAGGRGISWDSRHDRGFGIDGSLGRGAWRLTGEHLQLFTPERQRFHFTFVRLNYEKAGRLSPFVGWYDWQDQAREMGNFRSLVVGTAYRVREELTLEAALSATSSRQGGVAWLQFHYQWQQ